MPQSKGSPQRLPIIEGLVILILVALIALTLMPPQIDHLSNEAHLVVDQRQLMRHYTWITAYKERRGSYPRGSGHQFILETWVSGIVEHTPENLSMFFVPGLRDSDDRYHELMQLPIEKVWKDLAATTSADTHYAGRSNSQHMTGGRNEAWMADDNEGGDCHRHGCINVLLGDGRVTTLTIDGELKGYGAVIGRPFEVGPASPHPLLQQLEK